MHPMYQLSLICRKTQLLWLFELQPKATGHKTEYKESERAAEWTVKKVTGGNELVLKTKASLSAACNPKEIGQISMTFEIPMYSVSNLQIKYLRILEQGKTASPYRWVRYITQSSSYVCRV
jgi:Adaptor complexes medium subunit family.